MSHAELTNKLNTQHSKIKSLEMKLHRARQKMEKEAISLDNNDNTDMLEMFDFAENSGCIEGNDDMKMLWQCQKDALACNGARQYRWHPRFVLEVLSAYHIFSVKCHPQINTAFRNGKVK